MHPQPRTKAQQDSRHESQSHAQRTGDYLACPGGGSVPMMITPGGGIAPVPGYLEAARERAEKRKNPVSFAYKKRMTARREIENGHTTDPKQQT